MDHHNRMATALSIPRPRTLKVLIVEDESRMRELLVDAISDMGFLPTPVRNAEEAARLLQTDPHDIAMLDLHLPGMGGMELFAQIRQRHPAMAVIVLTGFGDLESARTAITLDVVDFLTKPCHMHEIERALDRARKRVTQHGAIGSISSIFSVPEAAPNASASSQTGTLADAEREQILAALARHQGNRTAAAAALGISRRTLQYRLREYRQQGRV
jgi:DNA-binding NtrC family response regulator